MTTSTTPLPAGELHAALEQADLRALLLTLYHLTGDESWLDVRPRRDTRIIAPEDAGLSDEDQARIREAAFQVLSQPDIEPVVTEVDDALMERLMAVCLGERVPPEYAPMIREELGFAPRDIEWTREPADKPLDVLIVGAGVNGLLLGAKLAQLGIRYTIVEKNDEVGGTWLENRYPGCGVDTPNHAYSFSFVPPYSWRSFFSQRDQIQDYVVACSHRFGVRDRIRFETRVTAANWNEEARRWQVEVAGPDGPQTLTASVFVSAIGHFNQPFEPDIPGRDTFEGTLFHSARWPDGLETKGKRIALVGTGASSMQIVTALADSDCELTVYQRTPQWVRPIPRWHEQIGEGVQWLIQHVPAYARWFRFLMFWRYGDGLLPFLKMDPDWPQPERSLNRVNEKHRQEMEAHIRSELADRPDLLEHCIPDYPPYGKRILLDFGWYQALRRPNVELIPAAVERLTPHGVVAAGVERAADIVVLATGFEMGSMTARLNVTGRDGADLAARWAPDNPTAYLGLTVPDFPNMFIMLGPNTGLGHGGSAIFLAECQSRYISAAVVEMTERRVAAVDVRPERYHDYVERVDREHQQLIWSHPGMTTYYRNKSGRVFSVMPWRLVDYWQMSHDPDFDDYRLTPAA